MNNVHSEFYHGVSHDYKKFRPSGELSRVNHCAHAQIRWMTVFLVRFTTGRRMGHENARCLLPARGAFPLGAAVCVGLGCAGIVNQCSCREFSRLTGATVPLEMSYGFAGL